MRRADLKNWAKMALNRSYWTTVLVAFIFYATIYAVSYITAIGYYGISLLSVMDVEYMSDSEMAGFLVVMVIILGICFLFSIVAFLIKILVVNPIQVGCQRYFCVGLYQNNPKVNEVGVGFKGNYKNVIKTLFFKDLYLFLWGMLGAVIAWIAFAVSVFALLIFADNANIGEVGMSILLVLWMIFCYALIIVCEIPYIVKFYEYMMIPYILADNPNMPRKQVFALTKQMMKGDKWNAFVLQLSFLGWDLLSVCTCGILSIFYVEPYRYYTLAAFYKTMQQKVEMQMQMQMVPPQQMPMQQMAVEEPHNF